MDNRFDGDALNCSIAIDNYLARMWYNLAPHRNVFVLNEPGMVSDNISIPKTVVATISNWLSSDKGYDFTPTQLSNFNMIPSV